jgi:predicted TPR repeat methyltransferase
MRPNSYFVFTAESCEDGTTEKGYKLLKNGRFGYTQEYIEKVIASLGSSFRIARYCMLILDTVGVL